MNNLKLYILAENTASGKFQAEHGLSYYIECDTKILFDTGHSDLFLKNAEKFNVDLKEVSTIVLSHGHWDHGDGLRYVSNKKLICHPDVFQQRFRKGGTENIGLALSFKELKNKFDIVYTRSPYKISNNITFLGEIPRNNSFEAQTTYFELENKKDDFVPDDSGLVLTINDKIIVISGCAHSGICNIIEHAKVITGISKIRAVIGGFHLKFDDTQTRETINYFKSQEIDEIYPSHCTELPALAAFYNEFKIKHLKTGMILNF